MVLAITGVAAALYTFTLLAAGVVEGNLRQRFGVIVVGIQRSSGRMEFNPAPDAVMQAGDQLIVLGRPEQFKDLEASAET